MRKFFIFLLLSGIFVLGAENKITKFEGGFYDLNIYFHSSALTGISTGLGMKGNTISSLSDEPAIVSLNPAALGNFQHKKIAVDLVPPFSLAAHKLYDINSKLENLIAERKEIEGDRGYPDVEANFGQKGCLTNFAFNLPVTELAVLGISYHNPFRLELDMIGNGAGGILTDASPEDSMKVSMSVEMFSSFLANFNQLDLGAGRRIDDKMSAGLGLNWLFADVKGDLTAKFDGMIRRFGDEQVNQSFNDPDVNFRDTLDDSIRIAFNSTLFSATLGFNYRYSRQWQFDSVLQFPTSGKFDGSLKIVQHSLGFLNENSLLDAEEELLDQTLLELSKMTYTNRTVYESTLLKMKYPGKFAVGAGWSKRYFDAFFSYEKPLGELSFQYKCDVREDGREKVGDVFHDYERISQKDYTYGLNLKHILKLGFVLKHFTRSSQLSVGTQLILADQIISNIKDNDGNLIEPQKNILIPALNAGLVIDLSPVFDWNLSLLAFPGSVFRSSLVYKF